MTQRAHLEHRQVASADLGRTQQKTVQISGGRGETFLASVLTSINIQESPELREPLLSGTLNEIADPARPGQTYLLAQPVVYHDPAQQIFALIIPNALRHQEFACRRELLMELEKSPNPLPEYMRRFDVIFDTEDLLSIEAQRAGAQEETVITEVPVAFQEQDALQARIRELEEQTVELKRRLEQAESAQSDEVFATLRQREAELADKLQAFQVDRQQLDEVASRIERDSARVDDARQAIQQEQAELARLRQELESERRRIQVMELNLEQAKLRLEQNAPMLGNVAEEKTQVVTDDQFIEIVEHEQVEHVEQSVSQISTLLPERFPPPPQSTGPFFWALVDEQPQIGFALPDERAQHFLTGSLDLVFQLHMVNEVPLIALTLLAFDEEGNLLDALAAPLMDRSPEEDEFLTILAAERHLELGVYGDDDQQVLTWQAEISGIGNLGWAREKIRHWQSQAGEQGSAAAENGAAQLAAGEVELWGTMRHPFHPESFTELSSASEVQLAVGILQYWSLPDQVDYLVGNRAFPIQLFIEIQKRVIRQALHWGIVPSQELREIAIAEAIIPDHMSLTQRLLANFAELCVGIRPNDLDPLEQWENWEALIQLAEQTAIQPDPDVLELAEISLKRAQEFEEMLENNQEEEDAEELDLLSDELILETFDDLSSLEKSDLISLLDDQAGRLEAAQMLVERYGAEALEEVLLAAEEMNAAQLEALSRTMKAHAEQVEQALRRCLLGSGPAGLYLAAQTLHAAGNTDALPDLLTAAQAKASKSDVERMANSLASFGDELLPPLTKALRSHPQDPHLLRVLLALEQTRQGTLKELRKDRNKNLRKAVDKAQALASDLK